MHPGVAVGAVDPQPAVRLRQVGVGGVAAAGAAAAVDALGGPPAAAGWLCDGVQGLGQREAIGRHVGMRYAPCSNRAYVPRVQCMAYCRVANGQGIDVSSTTAMVRR